MERHVLAVIGITLVAACGGPEEGSMLRSEFQTAIVDEPDGRVSFYSGHLIADALARGDDLESLSFMTAFLRVRVPRALVDMVPAVPDQPVFISLEQADPGVEILLHDFDDASVHNGRATRMANTNVISGDAWLTGHAQVVRDKSGVLVGGAHIVKYSGTLPLGTADHTWGMTSCAGQSGCPALRYDNPNPCLWPLPLPASWTLTTPQGEPQMFDQLCR